MSAIREATLPISEARAAFDRLAAKAPALARSSAGERIAKLQRLLDATLGAQDKICAAVRQELGNCDADIVAQLLIVKFEAEFAIKHLKDWMTRRKLPNSVMTMGKTAYVQYEPKGVVLNLSTWNAPFAIGLVPAVGAIAAGNAVLLKPSELAPHSARVLREIIRASMPEDEFAVVEGGPEVAQELLSLPFNHIYYTGGQHVGRIVMKAAADHFASVTLEMGGKNPVIIDETADIPETAKRIAWGRLSNAGQVCVAPDYALIHRSKHDEFVAEYAKAATAMFNPDGKGFAASPEYPRLISTAHFFRVKALVDDATGKGAAIAFGGGWDAEQRFMAPMLLTGVTDAMQISRDEIFGPVLPVMAWDDREQVVRTIAARPKPLALYIYSTDRPAIEAFLSRTSAGSTVVNHNMIQSGTNPLLPFGGANHSGIGRIGGHQSFLEFSNARSVVEDPLDASTMPVTYPPYPEKYKAMMKSMLGRSLLAPAFIVSAIEAALKLRALFAGGRKRTPRAL